jgi:hypothetical protein
MSKKDPSKIIDFNEKKVEKIIEKRTEEMKRGERPIFPMSELIRAETERLRAENARLEAEAKKKALRQKQRRKNKKI